VFDSVPIRVRSEPIPISIIFVSFNGGDNRAELQCVLPTFLTCVTVVLHFLYSCGVYYFPDSEDAPGRRLAALSRRLFPCNDFHGSCSPDLSRSKRVCVTLLTLYGPSFIQQKSAQRPSVPPGNNPGTRFC